MVNGANEPSILLSYDVPQEMRGAAARVSHLIFGRGDQGRDAPLPYIRRPGVVWLGQSVLLLPSPLARELAVRLEDLGANVAVARVTIPPAELEAFRHRMRRHLGPETCLRSVGGNLIAPRRHAASVVVPALCHLCSRPTVRTCIACGRPACEDHQGPNGVCVACRGGRRSRPGVQG